MAYFLEIESLKGLETRFGSGNCWEYSSCTIKDDLHCLNPFVI